MSYFKNKGFWFWGFIVLFIFNLSIFATMGYHIYQHSKAKDNTEQGDYHCNMKKGVRSRHSKKTNSLIQQLNLSEEQQEELGRLRKEHFKKMKVLKRDLMHTQHQLFDEVGKEEVDSAKLNDYRSHMMDLQGAIADESIQFLGEMKQYLSTEQQELMKQHFNTKYKRDNINN